MNNDTFYYNNTEGSILILIIIDPYVSISNLHAPSVGMFSSLRVKLRESAFSVRLIAQQISNRSYLTSLYLRIISLLQKLTIQNKAAAFIK